MKQVSLLLFIVVVLLNTVQGLEGVYSVYNDGHKWLLVEGKAEDYIAVAQVDTNTNETGWASIEILTNGVSQDNEQAFAAGYIEGALTSTLIYQSWQTNLEGFFAGKYPEEGLAFLMKNDEWVRSQVDTCKFSSSMANDCDYWYQIGLVLSQLDGMFLGYNEHCDADQRLPYEVFLAINADADIGDILTKVNVTQVPKTPLEALTDDHCSVLIKYSESEQQLYHSHVTWGHYINMLRVFKHYTFKFSHPSTQSQTVSFSSFPGFIASGDDYFITDMGLIVTETTNDVFNMSLYDYVTPETVLYWLRVVVSNRMSSSGQDWVQTFAKYNSGTYNNQWQVTDTKLFTPGQPFQNGTLWVLEQIPGFCVSEDLTSFLTNEGHFPSYNIPYFPFIYNISGYPEQYKLYGDAYSYESCPRANIFRRDQSNVVTFADFQNLMRYNEYQTDPFALGNPCNGISARCDLNTTVALPFGGYDCKASSSELIKQMTTTALSGPTTVSQPAFSWTGPFEKFPHYGQPTLFNFSFENMQPTLTSL